MNPNEYLEIKDYIDIVHGRLFRRREIEVDSVKIHADITIHPKIKQYDYSTLIDEYLTHRSILVIKDRNMVMCISGSRAYFILGLESQMIPLAPFRSISQIMGLYVN